MTGCFKPLVISAAAACRSTRPSRCSSRVPSHGPRAIGNWRLRPSDRHTRSRANRAGGDSGWGPKSARATPNGDQKVRARPQMGTKKCARDPKWGPKSARARFPDLLISREKPQFWSPTKHHQNPQGLLVCVLWLRHTPTTQRNTPLFRYQIRTAPASPSTSASRWGAPAHRIRRPRVPQGLPGLTSPRADGLRLPKGRRSRTCTPEVRRMRTGRRSREVAAACQVIGIE